MKIIRTVLIIVMALLLGLYGYYNVLSYRIYRGISTLEQNGNQIAAEFSRSIIIEKYPYSIFYFMVKR